MVQYFVETCPKCKSHNWMYNGDPNDLTYPDIEGIECWNCHHKWIPDELEEIDDDEEDSIDYTLGENYKKVN